MQSHLRQPQLLTEIFKAWLVSEMPRVIVFISVLVIVNGFGDIHKKLRYFETLQTVNIVSRRRRRADGEYADSKEVRFRALGRNFHLVLFPGTPILASDFQASAVDGDGKETPFHVDPNDFYTGHLADDANVAVVAHFEDDVLSTSIQFHNDTYAVEPAWRHVPVSSNHSVIVYRESDMLDVHNGTFCGGVIGKSGKRSSRAGSWDQNVNWHTWFRTGRQKRWSEMAKSCTVFLVADYLFFRDTGRTIAGTSNYLIGLITRIDKRFRNTVWEPGLTGFGFLVKGVLVHTEFSKLPNHYNSRESDWDPEKKLYRFSGLDKLSTVCLGHLYTSWAFRDNMAGLAYVASPRLNNIGGICRPANTAWTTTKNRYVSYMTLRVEMISSHELGHNWGALHDPDTTLCAPSDFHGGRYIMWPYAVNGWKENNYRFSPCSLAYIALVLKQKSHVCFTDTAPTFCGNGLLEGDEECDDGRPDDTGVCCTSTCKLRPGATCSDINFECCRNCQPAARGTRCGAENYNACQGASFCHDSDYKTCLPPKPAADGTPCIQNGTCYGGVCRTYCEVLGKQENKTLEPCHCEHNATEVCRFCCTQHEPGGKEGKCEATDIWMPDGSYCGAGYCSDHKCITEMVSSLMKLYRFFSDLSTSKLAQFMKANIVLTVLVILTVVWIPASKYITALDKSLREVATCRPSAPFSWRVASTTFTDDDTSNLSVLQYRFSHLKPGFLGWEPDFRESFLAKSGARESMFTAQAQVSKQGTITKHTGRGSRVEPSREYETWSQPRPSSSPAEIKEVEKT